LLGLAYFFGFHGLNHLDAYFDRRESKAIYTNLKGSAPVRLRSMGDKV
jgi:hypothetical protein